MPAAFRQDSVSFLEAEIPSRRLDGKRRYRQSSFGRRAGAGMTECSSLVFVPRRPVVLLEPVVISSGRLRLPKEHQ
jgi:hypothetical protein